MNIKKRLYYVTCAVAFVILGGSLGYYILYRGEASFVDSLYMTIISLTTVGFGEVLPVTGNPGAQVFTMVLITFGMGVILYGISMLTALLIEGELSGILRRKQMEKQIGRLREHYIVCGGGETGRPLIAELIKNRVQVVLLEIDEANIQKCRRMDELFYIQGDATEDQNLIDAGIQQAAGILICTPSDKDNLYVTMTARMLNRKIRIISRMINDKIREKLIKAGANSVVSPNSIGALRMASEMIRPAAVDFLDSMLRSNRGNLRINQVTVSNQSGRVGQSIAESGIKDKFNLLVLGARDEDGEILFNPPLNLTLRAGMTLVVMGEVEDIVRAKKAF